jgi:hypothetical protein
MMPVQRYGQLELLGTKAVANRPQQRLGQGDLPDMTDAAAQAGQDRN